VASESIPIISIPSATAADARPTFAVRTYVMVSDYWALTKPEVNSLIAVATFTGFYLGHATEPQGFPFLLLIHTLLSTLMVASGTGTLNQYIERRFDAQMRRTARRPMAAGRLKPDLVLWFGVALSAFGSIYLAIAVNALASLLAIVTLLSYLFIYTPLKRKAPLCTLVGAFPGAMPPLIGWAAASGRLSPEAWALYAALFLWQFPHFMAIAWMYREDYSRAGYLVLPSGKSKSGFMGWLTVLPLLGLNLVSLIPAFTGHAGPVYPVGAMLLGSSFLYFGVQLVRRKSNLAARRLLQSSIVYLPLVFILLMVGRS
jgi:protoheme IX farnesyltransferase